MILEKIKQLSQDDMEAVNQLIRGQLASDVPLINELAGYLIGSGGKRLRPLLAILTAKCFNYQGVAHISLAAIIDGSETCTPGILNCFCSFCISAKCVSTLNLHDSSFLHTKKKSKKRYCSWFDFPVCKYQKKYASKFTHINILFFFYVRVSRLLIALFLT